MTNQTRRSSADSGRSQEPSSGILSYAHALLKFAPPVLGVLMSLSGPLLSGGITGRVLLIATAASGLCLALLERLIALARRNNSRKIFQMRIQAAYTGALDLSTLAPSKAGQK